MNEKLVEQVARALAVQDGIQICSDASYAQSSYRCRAQAAIAAHNAFIREAAGRDDVVEAGCAAYWPVSEFVDGPLTNGERQTRSFRAMFDQIEGQNDA